MIALSVRGPWWWFILHAGKRVENRVWPKRYRTLQLAALRRVGGQCLLHASGGCGKREYEEACTMAESIGVTEFPAFDSMHRGGLVGLMQISGFVESSASPWFGGIGALVIEDNPTAIEFIPLRGKLGFFVVQHQLFSELPLSVARGLTLTDYHIGARREPNSKPVADSGQSALNLGA